MREREEGVPVRPRAAQTQIITAALHHSKVLQYHHGRIREVRRCRLMIVSVVVREGFWGKCLAESRLAATILLLNKDMVVVGMDSSSNIRHSSSMGMVVLLSRSMGGILLKAGILHRVDIILLVLGMAMVLLALDTDIRLNNSNNRVRPVAEAWVQWEQLR